MNFSHFSRSMPWTPHLKIILGLPTEPRWKVTDMAPRAGHTATLQSSDSLRNRWLMVDLLDGYMEYMVEYINDSKHSTYTYIVL